MTIKMFDLVGGEDHLRFSPFCWRAKMALAHKGLDFTTVPLRFTEMKETLGGGRTVPVIQDGDKELMDSWDIAVYLDETYADRPPLFAGPAGMGLTRFVQNWTNTVLHPALIGFVLLDIHNCLDPRDQDYFRKSRESRMGMSLEEVVEGREDRLDQFRVSLTPLRFTLSAQDFLCGDRPLYADYVVFGGFAWAQTVSDFPLLEEDDPVNQWLQRCYGLFDGMARQKVA